MKKHICKIDEDEWGIDLTTNTKEYFCAVCQKKIKSEKLNESEVKEHKLKLEELGGGQK